MLHDFERACQNTYSADFKLSLSDDLQKIVNYNSFTMFEIRALLEGAWTIGPVDSYYKSSFAFNSNVGNMVHLHFYKDFRYIFCNDENKDPVRYVIIFPAFHEATLLRRVQKMEKLKVFL